MLPGNAYVCASTTTTNVTTATATTINAAATITTISTTTTIADCSTQQVYDCQTSSEFREITILYVDYESGNQQHSFHNGDSLTRLYAK